MIFSAILLTFSQHWGHLPPSSYECNGTAINSTDNSFMGAMGAQCCYELKLKKTDLIEIFISRVAINRKKQTNWPYRNIHAQKITLKESKISGENKTAKLKIQKTNIINSLVCFVETTAYVVFIYRRSSYKTNLIQSIQIDNTPKYSFTFSQQFLYSVKMIPFYHQVF